MLLPKARTCTLVASKTCFSLLVYLTETKPKLKKNYSVTYGTRCILDFRSTAVGISFVFFLYKFVNTITFGIVTKVVELFLM